MDCPSKIRAIEALSATLAAVTAIWLWGHFGWAQFRPAGRAALAQGSLGMVTRANATISPSSAARLYGAAKLGDSEAQFAFARALRGGSPDVARDVMAARIWLQKAADSKHAGAAYILGTMYLNGEGGPADASIAATWFERAAALGSAQAMFMLANMSRAKGDHHAALELYGQAAEREHPAALQALSLAYEHGELGLLPDIAEARRFAIEAGHALSHLPAPL